MPSWNGANHLWLRLRGERVVADRAEHRASNPRSGRYANHSRPAVSKAACAGGEDVLQVDVNGIVPEVDCGAVDLGLIADRDDRANRALDARTEDESLLQRCDQRVVLIAIPRRYASRGVSTSVLDTNYIQTERERDLPETPIMIPAPIGRVIDTVIERMRVCKFVQQRVQNFLSTGDIRVAERTVGAEIDLTDRVVLQLPAFGSEESNTSSMRATHVHEDVVVDGLLNSGEVVLAKCCHITQALIANITEDAASFFGGTEQVAVHDRPFPMTTTRFSPASETSAVRAAHEALCEKIVPRPTTSSSTPSRQNVNQPGAVVRRSLASISITSLGMCTYCIVKCMALQDLSHTTFPNWTAVHIPGAGTHVSVPLRRSTDHSLLGSEKYMQLKLLGETIEELRLKTGLSARETAERAGMSPAYLRAIERGENPKTGKASRPSVDALLGIAAALQTDPAKLLELADYDPSLASRARLASEALLSNRSPEELSRRIQEAVRSLYKVSPFLQEVAQEHLSTFASQINLIANGSFRCSAEDEPHYSKIAVERCRSHLKAVSFQDLAWWRGDQGDEYLALHASLKVRDVEMTRIFVTPRKEWPQLERTLQRHVEIGIHTFVVDQDEVSGPPIRDFVLYDDTLLRVASQLLDDEESSKTAEFTDARPQIEDALNDFEFLRKRARRVDEVLLQLGAWPK